MNNRRKIFYLSTNQCLALPVALSATSRLTAPDCLPIMDQLATTAAARCCIMQGEKSYIYRPKAKARGRL